MICAGLVVGNGFTLKDDTYAKENFPTTGSGLDILEYFTTATVGLKAFGSYCEAIWQGVASTCRFAPV